MTPGARTSRLQHFPAGESDLIPLHRDAPASARATKVAGQLHQGLRSRRDSRLTEQAYCQWGRRFIMVSQHSPLGGNGYIVPKVSG
jgi:hypothetical protein